MHLFLAALLLASAASDPREQPPRCADMQRLSNAANRDGTFRALVDEGFAPPLLFGCRPAGNGDYHCFRNVTPDEVTPESYGAIIRDCLSGATLAEVEATEGFRPDTAWVVRHGRLTAHLGDSCTSICRAGRNMSITFTIDPDSPAPDQAHPS
jgi:hypothetical protein